MTTQQEEFLAKLINVPGPSGFENEIQKCWASEVKTFCPSISADVHGNCIATLKGEGSASVMIIGHADEVGLIINHISDEGFLNFVAVGGVDPNMLASQRVRILTNSGIVEGIIGKTSVHLSSREDSEKPAKFRDLWIDIGAKNKAEAESVVSIGDPAIFGGDYRRLLGTRAAARCFDNRIGLYIVAEAMRKLSAVEHLPVTVYGVSSVQEETGVWGAKNAAFALNPTLGIAIDVMPCTDSPGVNKAQFGDSKMSAGTVITRGVRSNNRMSNDLIEVAKKHNIPYQIEVERGHTFSDADPTSEARAGIPIGVISAPTRYLHTSYEVLDLNDLDACVDLVVEYILSLDKDVSFIPIFA